MPDREKDNLDVRKQIAQRVMRAAAKGVKDAPTPEVADAFLKHVGQQLQALPRVLNRLIPGDAPPPAPPPEIVPQQLAEFMKRRRGG